MARWWSRATPSLDDGHHQPALDCRSNVDCLITRELVVVACPVTCILRSVLDREYLRPHPRDFARIVSGRRKESRETFV